VVEAVGSAVKEVRPGDRVAYVGPTPGCYAEARVVPAEVLVPLPGRSTRRRRRRPSSRDDGRVPPPADVRREGGDEGPPPRGRGGVGLLVSQWAFHLGALVIGTVSTRAKATLARENGCAHAIVTAGTDFVAAVREITGGSGVDVVYDSVGGHLPRFDRLPRAAGDARLLRERVRRPLPRRPPPPLRKGSLYLTRPTLHDYTATREDLLRCAAALFDVVSRGIVRVEVRRTWPLRDVADAHRALEARRTTGSSVLLP